MCGLHFIFFHNDQFEGTEKAAKGRGIEEEGEVEDGTTENINGLIGNDSFDEQLEGSPIVNVNNIKLHLNLTKPMEKMRSELLEEANELLQHAQQGSFNSHHFVIIQILVYGI